MKNLIAIVAGEPNSINSEIIGKAWIKKKKLKNLFVIGNYSLLKKQFSKLKIKIPLIKINNLEPFREKKKLYILDVPLKFKSTFNVSFSSTKSYVLRCLDVAHDLALKKKNFRFYKCTNR